MKGLVWFTVAVTLGILAAGTFLTHRDSCSNPDFASYGGVTTCKPTPNGNSYTPQDRQSGS